jgi:probable HAF family extracellular repeat protein
MLLGVKFTKISWRVFCLGLAFTMGVQATPRYVVQPTGIYIGGGVVTALTPQGMLAGYGYDDVFDEDPWSDGFIWSGGTVSYQGKGSEIFAINNAGDIVGIGLGEPPSPLILRSRDGAVTNLTAATGGNWNPVAINDSDQIVGRTVPVIRGGAWPGKGKPCIYAGGRLTRIKIPDAFSNGGATGINDHGEVVGWMGTDDLSVGINNVDWAASPSFRAFISKGSVVKDLGTGNFENSVATAINPKGQIAGALFNKPSSADYVTDQHAFRYSNGAMTDLGTLPGGTWSTAYGINAAGDVVGDAERGGADDYEHGFIWSQGVMTDLNDLISPAYGITIVEARAISDSGVISAIFGEPGDGKLCLLWPIKPGVAKPRLTVAGGHRIVVHDANVTVHGTASESAITVTCSVNGSSHWSFAQGARIWSRGIYVRRGHTAVLTFVAHGQGGDSQPYQVTVVRR